MKGIRVMEKGLFLGVDVGTTAIKAAVYDFRGQVQVLKTVDSAVLRLQQGWSEQNMENVWLRTVDAIRSACSDVDVSHIASIGVCGQGDGLWSLDANRAPVRNAILWNDQRSEQLVLDWIVDGTAEKLSRFSHTSNWPGSAGSVLRWLKENEPDNVHRIETVFFSKDWINFRLTGNLATDFSDATIPFLDLETGAYHRDAFNLLGVEEMFDKMLTPSSADALHGVLSDTAADITGLPAGIPVAVGTIDLASMMLGMGLNRVGDICLILGTTAVVSAIIEPEPFAGQPSGATLAHPIDDKWIRVIAPQSGTSTVDWFTTLHPISMKGKTTAERTRKFNLRASQSPAGANGAMFLPFLAGERAPFVAPNATASFLGMTMSTTEDDLARAVMEGTAFSLKHCFKATGLECPAQAFMTGGGALSELWCNIVADVLGCTIITSDISDHGLWGAALLGSRAADVVGLVKDQSCSKATRKHHPDPQLTQRYELIFESYEEIVALSGAIWDAKQKKGQGKP